MAQVVQVQEALRHSALHLESTAYRIKKVCRKKFSKSLSDQWTNRLKDLAKESAEITHSLNFLIQDVTSDLENHIENPDEDYQSHLKRIHGSLLKRCGAFDPNSSDLVKKIKGIVDEIEGQEFEVVESEDTEMTFRCPFSFTTMKEPIKNANCPHHLDRISFESMLQSSKQASLKCPISGCNKPWTKSSISPDNDMELRMERYFRLQRQAMSSETRADVATEIED